MASLLNSIVRGRRTDGGSEISSDSICLWRFFTFLRVCLANGWRKTARLEAGVAPKLMSACARASSAWYYQKNALPISWPSFESENVQGETIAISVMARGDGRPTRGANLVTSGVAV